MHFSGFHRVAQLSSLPLGAVFACAALGGAPVETSAEPAAARIHPYGPEAYHRMGPEEYAEMAAKRASNPRFIGLDASQFDGSATFGVLPVEGNLISLVILGDGEQGLRCGVDFDGDGALSDAEWLPMEPTGERFAIDLEFPRTDPDGELPPSLFRIEIVPDEPDHLAVYHGTLREGRIRVGKRDVRFMLIGNYGNYSEGHHQVLFDRDGDGEIPIEPGFSVERYLVGERVVNIDGRSYTFVVDPRGDSLSLRLLDEPRPDRVFVRVGAPAPDFAFEGLDGLPHRLSDYGGRVVMLDFWGTWCHPCEKVAPRLVELYENYRNRGFEILGVHRGDDRAAVETFLQRFGMTWPQILQGNEEPLIRLYRIGVYPTHILIDASGTVVSTRASIEDLLRELERLLPESVKTGG